MLGSEFGDYFQLVKLSLDGIIEWENKIEIESGINDIMQTSDGGLILCGSIDNKFAIIKTDPEGNTYHYSK